MWYNSRGPIHIRQEEVTETNVDPDGEVMEEEVGEVHLTATEALILPQEAAVAMATLATVMRGPATMAATVAHTQPAPVESHITQDTEGLTAEKHTDTVATTTTEQDQVQKIETRDTTTEIDITTGGEEMEASVIMRTGLDRTSTLEKGHEKRDQRLDERNMGGEDSLGRHLPREIGQDLVLLVARNL